MIPIYVLNYFKYTRLAIVNAASLQIYLHSQNNKQNTQFALVRSVDIASTKNNFVIEQQAKYKRCTFVSD